MSDQSFSSKDFRSPRPAEKVPGNGFVLPLPGILGEIAEVAGSEAAFLIMAARGGTRSYIPPISKLTDECWLVKTVGRERAEAICSELVATVGILYEIPVGPAGAVFDAQQNRRAVIRNLTREGRSAAEVAVKLNITARTVHRTRALLRRSGELP